MMPVLSLACVNIEMSNHLDRVTDFLRDKQIDVICFPRSCMKKILNF